MSSRRSSSRNCTAQENSIIQENSSRKLPPHVHRTGACQNKTGTPGSSYRRLPEQNGHPCPSQRRLSVVSSLSHLPKDYQQKGTILNPLSPECHHNSILKLTPYVSRPHKAVILKLYVFSVVIRAKMSVQYWPNRSYNLFRLMLPPWVLPGRGTASTKETKC